MSEPVKISIRRGGPKLTEARDLAPGDFAVVDHDPNCPHQGVVITKFRSCASKDYCLVLNTGEILSMWTHGSLACRPIRPGDSFTVEIGGSHV